MSCRVRSVNGPGSTTSAELFSWSNAASTPDFRVVSKAYSDET